MRTQVAIVGAGPAGTLLGILLRRADVDVVVVERRTRQHVVDRIRAGVLEPGSVDVLRAAGAAGDLDRVGVPHDGVRIAWADRSEFFDISAHTGRRFVAYGQSPLQRDLYDAADALGLTILDAVSDVALDGATTTAPSLSLRRDGRSLSVEAEFVVGCDGYHGVCRAAIPPALVRTYERQHPFAWLGVVARSPPLRDLVYCGHGRGFALASQRSATLSRYYVQCPSTDRIEEWPDERFWPELRARFPAELREQIVSGPIIERSVIPVRSFVVEPLRHGHVFLAGDAAHIVAPTGAKGLNLAISDVHLLARGLIDHLGDGDDRALDAFSDRALARIWPAVRFSSWMTALLHRFPDETAMDQRLREAELDHLAADEHARASFCEQYVGAASRDAAPA